MEKSQTLKENFDSNLSKLRACSDLMSRFGLNEKNAPIKECLHKFASIQVTNGVKKESVSPTSQEKSPKKVLALKGKSKMAKNAKNVYAPTLDASLEIKTNFLIQNNF